MTDSEYIYFVSDFHLGYPNRKESLKREQKIISWLNSVKEKAREIYLLGDIFDFWYEWKYVIPRGYIRFLGKLAELSDYGIKIHYFTGNHDVWAFDYFEKELGITIHNDPFITTYNNKKFFIHHGDGLDNFDKSYKIIRKIFYNKFLQWCFSRLHPNFAFFIANTWSKRSRSNHPVSVFKGKEKEHLYWFCLDTLKKEFYDYFVFGHRHLSMEIHLNNRSIYFNTGDWINLFTYGEFDGETMKIKTFESSTSIIVT